MLYLHLNFKLILYREQTACKQAEQTRFRLFGLFFSQVK